MDLTTQQLHEKSSCPACIRYLYRSRTPGFDPTERSIIMENTERLMPDDTHLLLKQIYQLADDRDMDTPDPHRRR